MRIFGREVGLPWNPPAERTTSVKLKRQPPATLVSQAFTVQPGAMAQAIQHTFDVIDSVHGDGSIPALAARTEVLLRLAGKFVPDQAILVNPQTAYPALVTAHEIGHVLDYYAFSTGQYESLRGSAMGPVLEAWYASDVYQELAHLKWLLSTAETAHEREAKRKEDLDVVNYLMRPEEIWPRAYSQWLAITSQDTALQQQLEAMRRDPNYARYFVQWSDADFDGMQRAIDALFRAKGWRP